MRSANFVFIAMAMVLQSNTGHAADRYECLQKCFAQNEAHRKDCASTDNPSTSNQKQSQCMNNSDSDYLDCFASCPPAPHRPSSSDRQSSPAVTRM